MRFCIDCANYQHSAPTPPTCKRTWRKDPVSGETIYEFCSVERLDLAHKCGPEGGFWQPITIPEDDLALAFPPRIAP